MDKKYAVYVDNRLMKRTTTRKKAERIAEEYTADGKKGSYASKLNVTHEPNTNVWAFLNKKGN